MPSGWVSTAVRTLRFRVMLWNVAVVLLTGLATLLALRESLRQALIHEVDQLLLEDVKEVQLAIRDLKSADNRALFAELDRKARTHSDPAWFVQLLTWDGVPVFTSPNTPAWHREPAREDESPLTYRGARVIRRRYRGDPDLLVRVGVALTSVNDDMARIDRLVLLIGLGLVIAAPLCGYWLAGQVTRPLGEISRRVARLQPGELDERLPLRGSGDELDQLSQTFNGLLDRIGAYLREKRDLLANAAHELRTPLAAIRSSAELALSQRRSPAENEELLADIIEEGGALETLVNQLLLLEEAEADQLKLRREPVPLDGVVRKAADMFQAVAESRGLTMNVAAEPGTVVEGNRQHLRQLANNLLDNAIKFTPPGGRVDVHLGGDPAASQAVLTVRDTGVGIGPEDVGLVFRRFYRADKSRRRDFEARGTGLGLSICAAIVAAHGGTIAVESVPGVGSTFTVRLPLSPGGDAGAVA